MARVGLGTLVPSVAFELDPMQAATDPIHREIDASLLSADISGFTRLTESLASQGREGAEIITVVVNACFEGLIAAAERFGGDVIKFGGDAVLVLFQGPDHQARALRSGQEMQASLRANSQARRYDLLMTVGINDGPFQAMVLGSRTRDILICGPNTTETLRLEAAADKGEVVASRSLLAAIEQNEQQREGGVVVHSEAMLTAAPRLPESLTEDQIARFVSAPLRQHFGDYADQSAQHRQAAIGFVVIDGVDGHLAQHGATTTARALGELLDVVADQLAPTGVSIIHSDMAMGAVKLLIGAGVPSATGDHADALVHAALALSRIDTPFDLRQGLNIGTVFAGFLGARHRRTFSVMGDAVNTAARMSSVAGPGEIIAVNDIRLRARAQVEGVDLEPMVVKGKVEPVRAFRVLDIGQTDRRTGEVVVPFVGRSEEYQALQEAIALGTPAAIVGPAGSGKTRLSGEAIDSEGAIVAAGGRYTTATPYAAFWAPLRACLSIASHADAAAAGQQLAAALHETVPELEAYASLIAPAFAAELPENEQVSAIAPEFRRSETQRVLTELLRSLSPEVTAILTEDTQWLDDASADLVEHLDRVGSTAGWTVVRSSRDDSTATSEGDEQAHLTIALGPLPVDAITVIITDACPRPLLRHELQRLVERAQGNPLFAIELALAAATPGAELPGSIEELIIARIDRLTAQQRRSVRLASVFGSRFELNDFAALATAAAYDLEPDLAGIEEIFSVEDGVASFRQLLYRDAAYSSLPFARRKRLHKTVGEHLETTADDLDAVSTLLSEHFALAQERRKCWRYSMKAAARATRQHSPADAEALYRRALDHAPRGLGPADRASAFEGLADALVRTGSLEEAHDLYGKARKLRTDTGEKLQLLERQGMCRDRQGRYTEALRIFTRIIKGADEVPSAQAAACNGRASVSYRLGRAAEAFESAEQALAIAERGEVIVEQAQALKMLHIAGEAIGESAFAQHAERAIELVRQTGNLSLEAAILNNIGVSEQLAGRLASAASAYRDSQQLMLRVGDRMGAAMVQMNLCEVELDQQKTVGVAELLHECIAEFDSVEFTIGSTYSQGLLGRHALLTGNAVEAAALLRGAADAFEALGADGHAADMELGLIDARLQLGDLAQAERLLAKNRDRITVFDNTEAATARIDLLAERLAGMRD